MRDRSEIRREARATRGVLRRIARYRRDVDLLAIGPTVFAQRTELCEFLRDGPLIFFGVVFLLGGAGRLSRPGGGDAQGQFRRKIFLNLAGVGIDDGDIAKADAKAISGASIESDKLRPVGGLSISSRA